MTTPERRALPEVMMRDVPGIVIAIATMLLLFACGQDQVVVLSPDVAGTATSEVIHAPPRGVLSPSAGPSVPSGLIIAPTPTPYSGIFPPRAASTLLPEPTPIPTSADCGIFDTAELAHVYFLNEGGPFIDPHELDTNGDGIACNAPNDAGFAARRWKAESPAVAVSPSFAVMLPTPSPTASPSQPNPLSPSPQPHAGAVQMEATETPEPLELWEVDWAYLEDERLVDIVAQGERLGWSGYIGPDGQAPPRDCVLEVGTSADETNPTWRHDERRAWLWVDPPEDGGAFCVGATWSTKQKVFPIPVYTG